jgi:ribonuclease P protein component
LSERGRRVQAGALWCTFVLDPAVQPPQVAFSISRAVGTAVVRNRLRRRLRAILQARSHDLPGGTFLFGARPRAAVASFDELVFAVTQLLDRLRTNSAASPVG